MTEIHPGLAKLREPFDANQIGKLPKPYKKDAQKSNCRECGGYHGLPAAHLDFVGHAALTDRLLDADLEWYWEPFAVDEDGLPKFDKIGGLWIRLFVCGTQMIGYGHPDGKTGGNAIKEAIGDALRNSGMRRGAALDLWHKGDLHDAEMERGTAAAPESKPAQGKPASKPAATKPKPDDAEASDLRAKIVARAKDALLSPPAVTALVAEAGGGDSLQGEKDLVVLRSVLALIPPF